MAFDIQGARQAGYSDDEIAGFMAEQSGFDLPAARKAGYQTTEILDFLSKPAKASGAEVEPPATGDPLGTGASEIMAAAKPDDGRPSAIRAEAENLRDSFFTGVDNTRAALKTVNVAAQANQLQKVQRQLAELESKGQGNSREAEGLRKTIEHYSKRLPSEISGMTEAQADAQRGAQMTTRPAVAELNNAKTFGEAWDIFKKNPYDIIAGVTATSLPTMLPGLIAGAVMGPATGAVTMGASSAITEAGSSLADYARDSGVDVTDPKAVEAFFSDRQHLADAMSYAGKRAGIIGTLDAVSGGVAGKTVAPAFKSPLARQAVNMPAQMAVQAGLGAGGEAGGQLATKGEIDQPGQVLAEAAGELAGAPMEVAAFSKEARDSLIKKPAEQPITKPIADIAPAKTVDEAIVAAQQSLNAVPVESVQAVQNIERILGESNVSPSTAVHGGDSGTPGSGVDLAAPGVGDRTGTDGTAVPAVDQRGPAAELPAADLPRSAEPDLDALRAENAALRSQAIQTLQSEQGAAAQVEPAPAVRGDVPAEPELPAAGPAALETRGVTATLTDKGTALIRGDIAEIKKRLDAAGIKGIAGNNGVTVNRSQAQQAMALFNPLEDRAPQPVPEPQPTPPNPAAALPTPEQQRADFAATEAKRQAKAARLRSSAFDKNPLMAFLGKHGVNSQLANEFAPGTTERRKAIVPGYGPVFRRAGLNLDALAERAAEEGFLPPGSRDADAMYALIQRAMRGQRVMPQYAEGAVEQQAEAALAARYEDFLENDALAPVDLEADIEAVADNPEEAAQIAALLAQAEAQGIDAETVLEEAARITENGTQEAYYATAKQILRDALDRNAASRREDAAGRDAGRGQGQQAERRGGGESRPGAGAPRAEAGTEQGLTAPTRADVLAQQDRTAEAEELDQRAQVRRESEAGAGQFSLTQEDGRQDNTGDLFSQSAEPAPQKTVADMSPADLLRAAADKLDGKTDETKKISPREAAAASKKARDEEKSARRKEAAAKAAQPLEGLSVGTLPNNAEPVSVKNGVVYIGKYPAQNFDTGEDVTVPKGATRQQVMDAINDAGALGKRARFFGDKGDDTPMFSRGSGEGVPMQDARAVVSMIRKALPNAPAINLHDAVEKAPDSLLRAIYAEEAQNDAEAVYHGGEIHVFPGNIESIERMMFVVGHHEIRHYGLRAMLGPSLNDILLRLYQNESVKKAAQAKIDAGLARTRVMAVEEALADMPVETISKLRGFDKLVAAVRQWLRNTAARLRASGFASLADAIEPETWTDNDIAALVARAENMSRSGGSRFGSGGTAFARQEQGGDVTKTPAFRKWFGNSKVTDAQGNPLVVYHGTDSEFSVFGKRRSGYFFTDDRQAAQAYADHKEGGDGAPRVVDAYLSIKNPLVLSRDWYSSNVLQDDGSLNWDAVDMAVYDAKEAGHDGLILRGFRDFSGMDGDRRIKREYDQYVVFRPEQIKSATDNNGDFDPKNPDIRFSRKVIIGQTNRQYTPEQLRAMENVGFQKDVPTLKERAQVLWKDAGKKMAQGIFDQFAPVKDLDSDAYTLLRMSKGASGAFEVLLHGGQLKITDNIYDFDDAKRGGVLERLLMPLQGEHHDFLRWVAANRAERLTSEGRENLFTAQDIADIKTLANGTTDFDYTIQTGPNQGRVTRDRTLIYADAQRVFNEFNKNVLDLAEQSGLIDGASRHLWEHEFYVPFYRVADEQDGGIRGANIKSGVVRQEAFKKLKGGSNELNADLLDNTLMNWAHLLDAAAKNRAAKATIEAGERMGVAHQVPEGTKHSVWFMDKGKKHHAIVDDPYVLTAITALEYAGMRNPVMNAMSAFKHYLTIGVTASPFFKVRNLIRDSVQAIGTSKLELNPIKNVVEGWNLTDPKSDAYFRLMAGGGTIHFGTMLEGSEAKRVQALVESGVDKSTILDSDQKVKAFYRQFIEPAITAYNELGNRGEAVNRASLYDQLRKQGMSHADANLQARDLMDFSMQGGWTTIRFLTQVVPFLNARLQGLYKLGRAAKEDPARMATVLGAVTLLSLSLLWAYGDDDDWKKREDWDRDNYWWFKIGGTAFRIPKPFEIGAVATLAERGWELAFDKEMTAKRFGKVSLKLLSDQLAMNPIPQLVKPILDIYANKDSFTGRPIETMGMERLRPEYRYTDRTSMTARGLSAAANSVTGAVGVESPSPVQFDHLLRGYFGWLGSFIVGSADTMLRPLTDQPSRAAPDLWKVATGGMVSDLRDAPSRYVSQMYDQAKEIEQAYGTWNALQKQGKREEANEFAKGNLADLRKYDRQRDIKQAQSQLNERIRIVERSNMDPDVKRDKIRQLQKEKDRIARYAN